jgi:hypothetical protein
MKIVSFFAVAFALCAVPAAASRRPPGFNDAVDGNGRPHDPGSIMRGTHHYRKSLEHNGYKFGRGFERIKPNAGHSHLPHIHDFFNFTGTTDGGFLDMRHNALIRNTTINLDDYLELLTASGVSMLCSPVGAAPKFEPAPAGTMPSYNDDNKLDRNNVQLAITVPAALDAASRLALEHLRERLQKASTADGGVAWVSFGMEVMAAQAAFASGSSCAEQVPYAMPYYGVGAVAGLNADTWTLSLVPAGIMDVFLSMDSDINFDPNVERAHANRRHAGKGLGADVRSHGRKLTISATASARNGINWNGQTGSAAAASTSTIQLLPSVGTGVLTCENCYAYYDVSFTASFSFCVSYYFGCTYLNPGPPCDVNRDTTSFPYSQNYGLQLPDCTSLGTQLALHSYNTPTGLNFNFGMSASAKLSGSAGFNLGIKSIGYSSSYTLSKTSVSSLLMNALPAMSFGTTLMPLSILPKLGMDVEASMSAKLPAFHLGASGSASVDMGASMSLPNMWSGDATQNPNGWTTNTPTLTSYKTFTSSFTGVPLTIDSTGSFGVAINATLYPWYELDLFGIIPIQGAPSFNLGASIYGTNSRRLHGGRELATCISASAGVKNGLSVSVPRHVTAGNVLTTVDPVNVLNSVMPSSVTSTYLVAAQTVYSNPSLLDFAIGTPACPSPSPAAISSTSSSASTPDGLSLGAMIGISAGVSVAVALCVELIFYCTVCKKSSKPEPPAVITSNLTVRAVPN